MTRASHIPAASTDQKAALAGLGNDLDFENRKTQERDGEDLGRSIMIRIGVVSPIMLQASVRPFNNLVRLIRSIASSTVLVEVYGLGVVPEGIGNAVLGTSKTIIHVQGKSSLGTVLRHILTQLRMGVLVASFAPRVDSWIFYSVCDLTIPLIVARLCRKRVVITIGSSTQKIVECRGSVIEKLAIPFVRANHFLADTIVLYSPNLIEQWDMRQYAKKIRIANEHYVDFQMFNAVKGLDERSTTIGYVGRLSEEKASMRFVEAIPLVLREVEDARFVIAGDGDLRPRIEAYVRKNGLGEKVSLVGWVPHDELPGTLNDLRLLVVPSYTEGLPNVMLEAMACGTPVLVTPVGAVPDLIIDGQNGFILNDNSPDGIARGIARVLKEPRLAEVVGNALLYVTREFTYENTLKKWWGIWADEG